jgi:hypothetical protein
MVELDKESLRRLDTWIGVIARALRPDAPVASTTDGLRLGRKGSLSISADGWYDFEASVGGRDALILIQHLRGRSAEDAAYFALDWLGRYLGDGDFAAAADSEAAADAAAKRVLWATRVLDDVVDLPGTPSETYLRKRGLLPPYPPARQSGFRINVAGPVEGAPDYVITEGLENALALAQVSAAKP